MITAARLVIYVAGGLIGGGLTRVIVQGERGGWIAVAIGTAAIIGAFAGAIYALEGDDR